MLLVALLRGEILAEAGGGLGAEGGAAVVRTGSGAVEVLDGAVACVFAACAEDAVGAGSAGGVRE
ncbi:MULTISPECIES: hypothetical protein [unclassified Streptomyces]|uniref:hypothetical protein n=1 Tax=unclassified Streptomyces TaxID=2593676 RepID=UPI003649C264